MLLIAKFSQNHHYVPLFNSVLHLIVTSHVISTSETHAVFKVSFII